MPPILIAVEFCHSHDDLSSCKSGKQYVSTQIKMGIRFSLSKGKENFMTKYILIIALVAGSLSGAGAQETENRQIPADNPAAVTLMEELYGVWRRQGSVQDQQENANANSNAQNTNVITIEFNPEAKYVMKSGDKVLESGSYRVNERQSIVYLQIDGYTTEWRAEVNGNTLIMRARQPGHSKEQKYTYTKVPGAGEGTLDELE